MQQRMGSSLTYRHEEGINFADILDDLMVGSCLQTAEDVDRYSFNKCTATSSLPTKTLTMCICQEICRLWSGGLGRHQHFRRPDRHLCIRDLRGFSRFALRF